MAKPSTFCGFSYLYILAERPNINHTAIFGPWWSWSTPCSILIILDRTQ